MGHIIDKLSNSKYSRPALAGGLVIMLFFGAIPINQNAFATNFEEDFIIIDGVLFYAGEFVLVSAHIPNCEIEHWHATFGMAFSYDGTVYFEDPDPSGCGFGASLPGSVIEFVTLTTCDNPGEVCRTGVGICEDDAVCTSDGFCPDNEFIVDLFLSCNFEDDLECTEEAFCDGSGPDCPTAVDKPDTTMCGAEATECKERNTCDGSGNCSVENLKGPVECGGPATDCQKRNTCDSSGSCTMENFEASGTFCGFGDFECDASDECDGAGMCKDLKEPAGTMCGDQAGTTCTDPDTCDALGKCDENNINQMGACNIDICKSEICLAGTCAEVGDEPNGKICGPGPDVCNEDKECQAGACVPGGPVNCADGIVCTTDTCLIGLGPVCVHTPITTGPICGPTDVCVGLNCNDNNACTADSCNPASGCVNTAITCDDSNQCTADSCNPASGCVFTPTMALCNDNNSCTVNDMCDSNAKCVGNSNPACLVIDPNPDNETFDLDYKCENDSEVSISSATFTRDGEPLQPTDLSFYCPPGVILDDLEFGDIPNDFTADVTINGVDGTCVIEEGDDITAISFELVDGVVECFRGMGSDSIIILKNPDDGGVMGAAVGGTFIPIDSTLLLVAYAQNNLAWIIPLLMITAAIGFMKFGRSKSSENSI